MNPLGKDHVTALLDALLALDADGTAARAVEEVSAQVADLPGDYKVGVVIADDLMGGWTNRYASEFTGRFGPDHLRRRTGPLPRPRWLKDDWISAVLWSSEPASERAVREAVQTATLRLAYVHRHGPARTLSDMLTQEG